MWLVWQTQLSITEVIPSCRQLVPRSPCDVATGTDLESPSTAGKQHAACDIDIQIRQPTDAT